MRFCIPHVEMGRGFFIVCLYKDFILVIITQIPDTGYILIVFVQHFEILFHQRHILLQPLHEVDNILIVRTLNLIISLIPQHYYKYNFLST